MAVHPTPCRLISQRALLSTRPALRSPVKPLQIPNIWTVCNICRVAASCVHDPCISHNICAGGLLINRQNDARRMPGMMPGGCQEHWKWQPMEAFQSGSQSKVSDRTEIDWPIVTSPQPTRKLRMVQNALRHMTLAETQPSGATNNISLQRMPETPKTLAFDDRSSCMAWHRDVIKACKMRTATNER